MLAGYEAANAIVGGQIRSTVTGFLPGASAPALPPPAGGTDPNAKGYYNSRGRYVNGVWLPNRAGAAGAWVVPRGQQALPAPGAAGAFQQPQGLFGVGKRQR